MRPRCQHKCGAVAPASVNSPHHRVTLQTLQRGVLWFPFPGAARASRPLGQQLSSPHTAVCSGRGAPGRLTDARPRFGGGSDPGWTRLLTGFVFGRALITNVGAKARQELAHLGGGFAGGGRRMKVRPVGTLEGGWMDKGKKQLCSVCCSILSLVPRRHSVKPGR